MLRLLARTTGALEPMACSARRSQMTLQTPRSFNAWLRGQLKEKKMSQRQLALQSGVDHSTISRLIKGDRMPSLGTATKLARGLREISDDADGPAYFASHELARRAAHDAGRVRAARRRLLTEADVRELMQTYIAVRARRLRARRQRLRRAHLERIHERPIAGTGYSAIRVPTIRVERSVTVA